METMETAYNETAAVTPAATRNNGFMAVSYKLMSENRRGILRATLAYLGLWLALGLIWGFFSMNSETAIWSSYAVAWHLACWVFASMMFADMKTRQGRLSVLMTPASASAKFWPRVIATYFGTILIMVAGYLCEELGRFLGDLIMQNHNMRFAIPEISAFSDSEKGGIWLLIASYLLWQSTYFYGAILWPKASFVKTSAALICLTLVLSLAGGIFVSYLHFNGYRFKLLVSEDALIWIITSVMLLLSALLIWLAYHRFSRSSLLYGLRQK